MRTSLSPNGICVMFSLKWHFSNAHQLTFTNQLSCTWTSPLSPAIHCNLFVVIKRFHRKLIEIFHPNSSHTVKHLLLYVSMVHIIALSVSEYGHTNRGIPENWLHILGVLLEYFAFMGCSVTQENVRCVVWFRLECQCIERMASQQWQQQLQPKFQFHSIFCCHNEIHQKSRNIVLHKYLKRFLCSKWSVHLSSVLYAHMYAFKTRSLVNLCSSCSKIYGFYTDIQRVGKVQAVFCSWKADAGFMNNLNWKMGTDSMH